MHTHPLFGAENCSSAAGHTQPLFGAFFFFWLPAALSARAGVTEASTSTSAGGSGDGGRAKMVTIASALQCDAYQPPPTVHKYCNASMARVELAGPQLSAGEGSCTETSVPALAVPVLATCGRFGR